MVLSTDVTTLLRDARAGNNDAFNRLVTMLYPELKAVARRRASRSAGLSATSLVNEAFVRLLSGGNVIATDRQQFFGLAATIMRRVIVDEVRYLTAEKRKGDSETLIESVIGSDMHQNAQWVLEVNDALAVLEAEDARAVKVFECRYFAGLTTEETAAILSLSARSVERSWAAARSRLAQLLDDTSDPPRGS